MFKNLLIAFLFTMIPLSSFASSYQNFAKDSQIAVNLWKQSVKLTSRKKQAETVEVMKKFIKEWNILTATYKNDVPKEFEDKIAFQNMLKESESIAQKTLVLAKKGQLKEAHEVVEKIRYIMWELRAEAYIFPLIDSLNEFHELMEIVLETAEMSETHEEFAPIVNRYGYWMKVKWLEIGYKIEQTSKNPKFTKIFEEGKSSIDIFLDGAAKADIDIVDPAAHKVKKSFMKLFFSPEIY